MDRHFISNLLKGLVSTSFGNIVTVGLHFFSITLLTRYASREILGLYFLASAVVQVLKISSGLGLDLTMTKTISSAEKGARQDIIASIIAVRLVSVAAVGLIFYAAGRFFLAFFDARLDDYILTIIVLFTLTGFRELFLNLMQGVRLFKEYAFVEVFSAVSRVALLVVFRDRLTLQGLLYIEIASQLVPLLGQLFLSRTLLLGLSRRNVSVGAVRELTRFGAPLYSNNLLTLIYDRSSVFLIGTLMGPSSVAAFEVARKLPEGFMRLFNSFIVVYFPSLSNLFGRGERKGAQRIMNSSLVMLSVGIILLVLVAFLFAREIVATLFSQEYVEVSLAFSLLMLSFYLRAISNVLGYSLVAAGHPSAPVKANIVAVIVNIVASVVLIRLVGYVGAAYSLVLMNITTQVTYTLLLRRAGLALHNLEYLKPVLALAAALVVFALFGAAGGLVLKLALIGLYVVACWLLIGETRDTSRSILKHLLGSRKTGLATSSEDA